MESQFCPYAHSPLDGTQNSRLYQRQHVFGSLGRFLVLAARILELIAAAEESVLNSAVGGKVEESGLGEKLREDKCRSCDYPNIEFDCPIISLS